MLLADLIFGFEMSQVALLVAFVLGAVLLVRWGFAKDDQIEDRRKHALTAAQQLAAIGDTQLADLLNDYAVGDYSDIVRRVHIIIEELLKTGGAVEMRAEMVIKVLPELLKNVKYAARLEDVIAKAIADHTLSLQVITNGIGDATQTTTTTTKTGGAA